MLLSKADIFQNWCTLISCISWLFLSSLFLSFLLTFCLHLLCALRLLRVHENDLPPNRKRCIYVFIFQIYARYTMSLIFFTIVAKIRKQTLENKGNFSLILYFLSLYTPLCCSLRVKYRGWKGSKVTAVWCGVLSVLLTLETDM